VAISKSDQYSPRSSSGSQAVSQEEAMESSPQWYMEAKDNSETYSTTNGLFGALPLQEESCLPSAPGALLGTLSSAP
jgi:hypothetical protein